MTETIEGPTGVLIKNLPVEADLTTVTLLLAAKIQHECPLLGVTSTDPTRLLGYRPDVYASNTGRIYIHVQSWHGDHIEGTGDFDHMRVFRELASYFKPLKKVLNPHSGLTLEREYEVGDHTVTLVITPAAGTCVKKETGKTETKKVKKVVTPAVEEEVEEEVPVMEWECPPIFAEND